MVTITTPAPGHGSTADMQYFAFRWKVTKAVTKGLVFAHKTVEPRSAEMNIPGTVIVQSNPLLIAPPPL